MDSGPVKLVHRIPATFNAGQTYAYADTKASAYIRAHAAHDVLDEGEYNG